MGEEKYKVEQKIMILEGSLAGDVGTIKRASSMLSTVDVDLEPSHTIVKLDKSVIEPVLKNRVRGVAVIEEEINRMRRILDRAYAQLSMINQWDTNASIVVQDPEINIYIEQRFMEDVDIYMLRELFLKAKKKQIRSILQDIKELEKMRDADTRRKGHKLRG